MPCLLFNFFFSHWLDKRGTKEKFQKTIVCTKRREHLKGCSRLFGKTALNRIDIAESVRYASFQCRQISQFFKFPVAGLSISFPFSVKREPWHGQSQVCSIGFHFSAQPIWGQRLAVGVSKLTTVSNPLTANWG